MDLEFSIVLFENEGYATARGNKGVQDILAAKADAGYIKDGTYPIIFTLHPYCWKWWSSPKQEKAWPPPVEMQEARDGVYVGIVTG